MKPHFIVRMPLMQSALIGNMEQGQHHISLTLKPDNSYTGVKVITSLSI